MRKTNIAKRVFSDIKTILFTELMQEGKSRHRPERVIVSASISQLWHHGLASWSRKAPEKRGAERGGKKRARYVSLGRFFRVVASNTNRFSLVDFNSRSRPDDRGDLEKPRWLFLFVRSCSFSIFFFLTLSQPTRTFLNVVSPHAIGIHFPGNHGKSK